MKSNIVHIAAGGVSKCKYCALNMHFIIVFLNLKEDKPFLSSTFTYVYKLLKA